MALPSPEFGMGNGMSYQKKTASFLRQVEDPQAEMSASEQLAGMSTVYEGNLPGLLQREQAILEKVIDRDRRRRIMPFVMPDITNLGIPDDALAGRQATFDVLLYETAQGKLVLRDEFIQQQRASGRGLETLSGTWFYPIVDLSGKAPIVGQDTDSVITAPLELIATIHKVFPELSGVTQVPEQLRHTANERVFRGELNPKSNYRPKILKIIGLEWDAASQQMRIGNNLKFIGDNDTEMLVLPIFADRPHLKLT